MHQPVTHRPRDRQVKLDVVDEALQAVPGGQRPRVLGQQQDPADEQKVDQQRQQRDALAVVDLFFRERVEHAKDGGGEGALLLLLSSLRAVAVLLPAAAGKRVAAAAIGPARDVMGWGWGSGGVR